MVLEEVGTAAEVGEGGRRGGAGGVKEGGGKGSGRW